MTLALSHTPSTDPLPFLCAGEGPNVLLLHGCPGSMFSWRSNIARLAKDHRVYALDLNHLFGVGATRSLQDHARSIHRFMIRAQIQEARVVGHSMGAGVGIHLAAMAPQRVAALTLLGSLGLTPHMALTLCQLPGIATLVSALGPRMPGPIQAWLSRVFLMTLYNGSGPQASPEALREQSDLIAPGALQTTLFTARAANLKALRAACRQVQAPSLILHGTEDHLVSADRALELLENMNRAQLALIDGAGHMLHIEQAEEVNARLLKFWKQAT